MRAWKINQEFGIENLTLAERPDPQPGHGQIAYSGQSDFTQLS